MENVKLDNYGGSNSINWQWHGTVGKSRHPYKSARQHAIKRFGLVKVRRAETISSISDHYILAYVAEQLGCADCFGGLNGYSLVTTPGLTAKRYAAYTQAAQKMGVKIFANLPPNYQYVIDSKKDLIEKSGQLGLGPNDDPTERFPLCKF